MGVFYLCMEHGTVEEGRSCRAAVRLGPYDSPDEARRWRERVEARDEAWQAEDERWHGEGDEDDDW
jgi:hypothetical protein